MEPRSKWKPIAAWASQVILAALFGLAAAGKLSGHPATVEMFRDWGFPDGFFRIIGALELAGAVGLLIPRMAGFAAMCLVGIMIGAAATHVLNGEAAQVIRPGIFTLLLAVVIRVRRPWPFAGGD